MPTRPQIRRIAVLVELSTSLGRSILEGIVDFCSQEQERWDLLTEDWGDVGYIEVVSPGVIDGVISDNPLDPRSRDWRIAKIPVINVAYGADPAEPSIYTDVSTSAQMAAHHFFSRGLRNLAFLAEKDSPTSESLAQVYQSIVRDCDLNYFGHSTSRSWSDCRLLEQTALSGWLLSLPQPAGVFGASDILARRILQCCRQLNLSVPSQIAVLGMGDYELVNKLSNPPLSSVIQAPYQVGWGAAQLLLGIMGGTQDPGNVNHVLIPPKGVVIRESSSQAAGAENPLVAQSLRFIREHIREGLHVDDLARAASVSRRWLEQVFHKSLGRAPAAEIRRAQMETAARLLLETDWPLRVIARHCGLASPERLSALFRHEMGTIPGRFREKTSRPRDDCADPL